MATIEEIRSALNPSLISAKDKYAPKLSFDQRCAVLALIRLGFTKPVIAKAYGIDVRTIGRIISLQSPFYKEVRQKWMNMGDDAFIATFLPLPSLERVQKIAAERVSEIETDSNAANKRAAQKEGKRYTEQGIFVLIQWHEEDPYPGEEVRVNLNGEAVPGPGWYVQLPDTYPGDWYGRFLTSGAAWQFILDQGF